MQLKQLIGKVIWPFDISTVINAKIESERNKNKQILNATTIE